MCENEEDSITNIRLVCTECGWEGMSQDVDKVPDPQGSTVWQVCLMCRTPEHFVLASDGSNYRRLAMRKTHLRRRCH